MATLVSRLRGNDKLLVVLTTNSCSRMTKSNYMNEHRPTNTELALAFLQVGVSSFGGALPWARRVLVDERKWLGDKSFTEMLTIAQALPGPNIVNVAVYYGFRARGLLGVLASLLGLLVVPMLIVLGIAKLYLAFAHVPQIKGAILGMTAAATGFMFAQAIKLSKPFSKNNLAIVIALATFAIGVGLHWPMPLLLFTCGAVSVALAFKGKV
jgi:chromate transporter